MSTKVLPTFEFETKLTKEGYKVIVGIDEAGCGALAGPVVAGAVLLEPGKVLDGVKDSKLLNEKQRQEAYEIVTATSRAWAFGQSSVEEIFDIGIRAATYLAMRRALEEIQGVDFVLVDAWTIPGVATPQRGIIRGDQKIFSIAAASIIAKVTRDRMMKELHVLYPDYKFDVHKGYGTKIHQEAIKMYGPCPVHRLGYKTFLPKLI